MIRDCIPRNRFSDIAERTFVPREATACLSSLNETTERELAQEAAAQSPGQHRTIRAAQVPGQRGYSLGLMSVFVCQPRVGGHRRLIS